MTIRNPIGVRLRELLLANPQGMSVRELSKADGEPQDIIVAALGRNYGFYIAEYQKVTTSTYRSIWRVIAVPPNAPMPVENAECCDTQEALKQRKKELDKLERLAISKKRAQERKRAKIERDQRIAAEKQRKAEARAAMRQIQLEVRKNNGYKKAGGDDHVPQLTQIRGPWPTEVRNAGVH